MVPDFKFVSIGVDLGGTKVDIGLVDPHGKIIQHIKEPTNVKGGPQAIIQGIAVAADKLQKANPSLKVSCVGVGVAGQIDHVNGSVRFAPNLKWNDVPLQQELHKALGLPIFVANDVRVATWGEWLFGEGKGSQDLICLFVGTGIGGGVVSNGHIMTGSTNSAGELGHMTVVLNGRKCHCGNRGCLEAYAGGWAIGEIAREEIAKDPAGGQRILQEARGNLEDVTAKQVSKVFLEGDPLANKVISQAVDALIGGMVGIVNAFNPEKIVLGGGVINGLPMLVPIVEKGVKNFALKVAAERLKIVPAKLKEEAGVVGAAAMASRRMKNDN